MQRVGLLTYGIVVFIGRGEGTVDILIDGLWSLKCRGYDSDRVALGPGMTVPRRSDELDARPEVISTT